PQTLTTSENGQIAKKLSGLQHRQRDVVEVFICYPDADRAFFDDVKRVTMIVLVKDYFAGLVIDLIDLLRELFQFVWFKAFEKRTRARLCASSLSWVTSVGINFSLPR